MKKNDYYENKLAILKESNEKRLAILQENKRKLEKREKVHSRLDFISSGGPIVILMLLLLFIGVAQFIFVKIGMSTLLEYKEVNGFTIYYFNFFNYVKTVTACVDNIKNIPNNIWSDFTTNTDSVINCLITLVNCLIAVLNVFTIGAAFVVDLMPLICAIFGFVPGGLNFIDNIGAAMSAFHIPYIPYV
jgi:hypothetical protein